ncbi:aspartate/methionine/tyrosine aminotransferase [Bradyrhizobium diazoefficiens]
MFDLSLGHLDPKLFDLPSVTSRGFQYGAPAGDPELRAAIADLEKVKIDQVVVTVGASLALVCAMALAGQGKILVPRPYYPPYPAVARMLGLEPHFYPVEPTGEIDVVRLKELADPEVKVILINTPGNPLGNILTSGELSTVLEFASSRDAFVIVDEVYRDFMPSPAREEIWQSSSNLIRIFSFSKRFGMPGERLGYVIAAPAIASQISSIHWRLAMSAPYSAQQIATKLLRKNDASTWQELLDSLKMRRDRALTLLRKNTDIKVNVPKGGIFLWVDTGLVDVPSTLISDLLRLHAGILVQPASSFGIDCPAVRTNFAVPVDTLEGGYAGLAHFLIEIPQLLTHGHGNA